MTQNTSQNGELVLGNRWISKFSRSTRSPNISEDFYVGSRRLTHPTALAPQVWTHTARRSITSQCTSLTRTLRYCWRKSINWLFNNPWEPQCLNDDNNTVVNTGLEVQTNGTQTTKESDGEPVAPPPVAFTPPGDTYKGSIILQLWSEMQGKTDPKSSGSGSDWIPLAWNPADEETELREEETQSGGEETRDGVFANNIGEHQTQQQSCHQKETTQQHSSDCQRRGDIDAEDTDWSNGYIYQTYLKILKKYGPTDSLLSPLSGSILMRGLEITSSEVPHEDTNPQPREVMEGFGEEVSKQTVAETLTSVSRLCATASKSAESTGSYGLGMSCLIASSIIDGLINITTSH